MIVKLDVRSLGQKHNDKVWLAALPFAMSFALLLLLAWDALIATQGLPLHDEGLIEHLGMVLAVGQVPLIFLSLALRFRQLRAAGLLAALQCGALALVLGLIALSDIKERNYVQDRIQEARPQPGSDRAVRSFLEAMAAYRFADPAYPAAVRQFLDREGEAVARDIDSLGALQTVRFAGVDAIGWDIYAITFDRSVRHIHLFVADDSRLLGISLVGSSAGCLSSEIYDCRYLDRLDPKIGGRRG